MRPGGGRNVVVAGGTWSRGALGPGRGLGPVRQPDSMAAGGAGGTGHACAGCPTCCWHGPGRLIFRRMLTRWRRAGPGGC